MSRRKKREVYRDGQIHVNKTLCTTCIYRTVDPPLVPIARREQMERDANAEAGCIVCHETMDSKAPTICRGYYEVNQSLTLRLAASMGVLVFDPVPVGT